MRAWPPVVTAAPPWSSGDGRRNWSSTKADNPAHLHEQVVLTPELVARRSTLG